MESCTSFVYLFLLLHTMKIMISEELAALDFLSDSRIRATFKHSYNPPSEILPSSVFCFPGIAYCSLALNQS